MKTQTAVAMRIAELLMKNKMTVYSMCKKIGMAQETVHAIINERYKTIKLDTIIKICDCFNMTIQQFFDNDLFKRENLDVE